MLDQVLSLFDILPDVDLGLMTRNQTLAGFAAKALTELNAYIGQQMPDIVLVQGDTSTTFVASLAAFYNKIPVGHVEAGLRSGDRHAPFPEEINRVLTSHLADIHFAPTHASMENLLKEGIPKERIFVTGNTGIDALFLALQRIRSNRKLESQIIEFLDSQIPGFRFLVTNKNSRLILVTGHRRENFGKGFKQMSEALKMLAQREDVHIIYPLHLNPNVQEPARRILNNHPRIHLISPLDYVSFVYLMKKAYLILTDSGGIQEEAPTLGKPVLVMRDITERPEAVYSGAAKMVGTKAITIVTETQSLLDNPDLYQAKIQSKNPFGDGRASRRIVSFLIRGAKGRHKAGQSLMQDFC